METTMNSNVQAFWGEYEKTVSRWVGRAQKQMLLKRLWEKDPTLWTSDPEAQKLIVSRLGWLSLPERMEGALPELLAFADEVRKEGCAHVVLLGMGGAGLASWVFQKVYGNKPGCPELILLDSTDPEQIRDVEGKLDLQKTLFIVSSKSGGTIESLSLFKYFFEKVRRGGEEKPGRRFAAITDPGTSLEELAKAHEFRKIFPGFEDVGGRFSALSVFGFLPACLIGVDVRRVLAEAKEAAGDIFSQGDAFQNSALLLGVGMAVLAEEGRDKLTIVTSPGFEAFGDWAEQLIAESSGKEDTGIIPVVGEPLGEPEVYGEDRFFVALLWEAEAESGMLARLDEIRKAGHPVLVLRMKERTSLGAEFYRWEAACAAACSLLKINAFDQPDVQAAKDRTKALLETLEKGGAFSIKAPEVSLESFFEEMRAGDYVALLGFLPERPFIREHLETLRISIRDLTRNAVTVGMGPRYLHSTGQLHKGGPNKGVFLLITAAHAEDLGIPGEKYGFISLELAQALGDLEALQTRGRRVFHWRLPAFEESHLRAMLEQAEGAVRAVA